MTEQAKILLIEDEELSREPLTKLLKAAGYAVIGVESGEKAFQLLALEQFDIIVTDLFLPDVNGIDILKKVKERSPLTEVILITGHASAETAVKAMKEGAFDYITKPLNFEELQIIITKAVEKRQILNENVYLKKQLRDKFGFSNIIGNSAELAASATWYSSAASAANRSIPVKNSQLASAAGRKMTAAVPQQKHSTNAACGKIACITMFYHLPASNNPQIPLILRLSDIYLTETRTTLAGP